MPRRANVVVWFTSLILSHAILPIACEKKPEAPAPAPSAGGGGKPEADRKMGEDKPVELPTAVLIKAPASAGELHGFRFRDLDALKKHIDGESLVAAARLQPDGATFPEGIEVSWPLDAARTPGEKLWIGTLDAAAGRWLNTRRQATIDATGLRAVGTVYHFSDAGVLVEPPKKDDDKTPHVQINTVLVKASGHHTTKVDPAKLERVKQLYEKGGGAGQPMTKSRTIELYKAGDYATLKTLIERGVISPQHSMDMADMRLLMVLQAWEHIIRTKGNGKWKIYRADSGNQKAGMSSDMDQTVKAYEYREGKWVRVENLDWSLVELFKTEFPGLHQGLAIEAMDIATIAARDNPPEWRKSSSQLEAENKRAFALHDAETLFTLRRTPGAYTYTGAIVQQVQLRVLDMVERNLRTSAGEAAAAGQRAFHPELAAHVGDLKPNNMLFTCIGPDEKGGGEVKPREVFQEEAVVELFDGMKPALIRGHAYDAAVANYFEFMHHRNDKFPAVKYHLRALDDGLQAIERLKRGVARFEYANLHSAQRGEHLAGLLGNDLAVKQWDGRSFIDRWKTAFDISAKMRDHHSAKTLNERTYAESLEPLVREIFGATGDITNPEHIARARAEYNQRCQEFFLHNMIQTSEHRIAEFLRPTGDDKATLELFKTALDESSLRRKLGLEGPQHDAKWQGIREEMVGNYSNQARNQLLYSLRELASRPDVIKLIMDRAKAKGYSPVEIAELNSVLTESQSWLFNYREYKKFPDTYKLFAGLAAKKGVEYFAGKAWEGIKSDLGFIEAPEGPRPSNLLKSLGSEGLRTKVDAFLKSNRALAAAERRFGNAFLHIGAAQGVANVLRAYSEHDGDPIEFGKAVLRESAMLIFPHLGLAYGAYEAGTDWKQQALLVLCCISPTGGVIMVAVTIGEAGMAIYEHDYVEPLKNLTSDALYRGYVGPSLYDFSMEGTVSPFSDEDDARLRKLEEQIAGIRARIEGGGGSKGDAQRLAELGRDAKPLQMHRSAWKAFDAEQKKMYEGSSLLGKGAAPRQLVLELGPVVKEPFTGEPIAAAGSLLGRVQPIIFYSRNRHEGAVDFTVVPLTAAEKSRMSELEQSIPMMSDPAAAVDAEAEYESLRRRNAARERADRYLARAATNHELMLQIRRDSMYPSMLQDQGIAKMYDAKNFVETWIAIRKEMLPEALKKIGLESSLSPWDERVREELQERVWADLDRSKRLWMAHQMLEKGQREAEKAAIDARKCQISQAMMLDAVADGVISLSTSVRRVLTDAAIDLAFANSTALMGETILERSVPVPAPTVSVRIRELPSDEAFQKKTGMRVRLEHDVKVEADPSVYVPPYFSVPYILDPRQAQEAVGSRQWMGLPLDEDMVKSLQDYLKGVEPMMADFKPQEDPFDPALLVFVFCTDLRVPQRVVPEAVDGLPVLKQYDVRMPPPMAPPPKECAKGYLFGGAAAAPEPMAAPTGPLQIIVTRWPVSAQQKIANAIEIKSKAMAALDPKDHDTGLKFKIYRATSAGAPLEIFNEQMIGWVFGDTPVWKADANFKEPYDTHRKSADTFVIHEHVTPVHDMERLKKPVYYQIGQIPVKRIDGEVQEVGKEIKSNVFAPTSESILIIGYDKDDKGEPRTSSDGELSVTVILGKASQYFNADRPHLILSCAGWTGHSWGGGKIRVPAEGGTITVSADGDGMSGSGSISVPPNAARIDQKSKSIAAAQKNFADRQKSVPADVEDARKRLDEARKRTISKPGDNQYGSWLQEMVSRFETIRDRRTDIEYEAPRLLSLYARAVLLAQGDFKGVLAAYQRELALVDIRAAINDECTQALRGVLAMAEGTVAPNDALKKSKEQFIANLKGTLQRPDNTDSVRDGAYATILYAAFAAGDAGAYEAAVKARVALLTKTGEKKRIDGIFLEAAEQLVTLTGNQSKGVEYRNLAMAAAIEQNPSAAEQIRKNWEQNRPAWWPKGDH